MRLAGKVAVVTGGGSGIGRGIALCMAREGARLAIPDIRISHAESVAKEIQALGTDAIAMRCDVTREAEVNETFGRIKQDMGQIDILVNNAGLSAPPGMPFTRNTEEDWDRAFAVNVKSVFFTCKAIAPYFLGRKAGRIINIASIAGPQASLTMPPYSGEGAVDCRQCPHPCPLPEGEGTSFRCASNFEERRNSPPLPTGEGWGEGAVDCRQCPHPCPLPEGEGTSFRCASNFEKRRNWPPLPTKEGKSEAGGLRNGPRPSGALQRRKYSISSDAAKGGAAPVCPSLAWCTGGLLE